MCDLIICSSSRVSIFGFPDTNENELLSKSSGFAEVDEFWRATEAPGCDDDVDKPDGKPDSSDELGKRIEIPPDECTECEAAQGQKNVAEKMRPPFLAHHDAEVPECGEIHSHECKEGAEVE